MVVRRLPMWNNISCIRLGVACLVSCIICSPTLLATRLSEDDNKRGGLRIPRKFTQARMAIRYGMTDLVSTQMDYFDKRMALDVIEDALTTLGTPEQHGLAVGLCGAFYMCGLLSHAEWEALLARIPGHHGG